MDKYKINRVKMQVIIMCCLVHFFSCSEAPTSKSSGNPLVTNESRFYSGKGVGPVKNIILETIDSAMVDKGNSLFKSKCITCHRATDEKVIGPGLLGVTKRRTPEWIMNQILNPIGMTQSDSLAKELLTIYLTQMTPMDLTEEEARSILEFFRSLDSAL